jgi:hypothetical protein
MNNSSLNLINQSNNISHNLYKNYQSNRNSLKPNISFGKTNIRRNSNNTKLVHKNNKTSLDNYISGQIVEHINISSANTEKKDYININKNVKISNNNITMNSISTAGTKKNELEFSINSLFEYKDNEDKNINKNSFMPFTNRLNNERLQQKLCGNNSINRNINKHTFNKSLCQQSFIDKIFTENDLNLNLNENEKKNKSILCKSCDKLQNENKEINNLNLNQDNENKDNENKDKNNENEINEFNDEDNLEMDNYTRIKEDFNLLYNDEYIKQINEDLLKLEIELFFEKMSELFSSYHLLMDDKILENQIIKRDYKKNISKYLLYSKLYNKLQFVKTAYQTKNLNLKEKGINLDTQNLANVNINMNELNIFKIIFPDDNKCQKLKKIISIIMKKHANKELLDEKFKMLLK